MDEPLERILASWQAGQGRWATLLGGREVEHDGLVTTLTGIPAPWLNPVSVRRAPVDPAAALAAAEADHPPALGFGVDVVVDRFPRARAAIAASGLGLHSTRSVMAAAPRSIVEVATPAGIRLIHAEDRLDDVAEVDAAAFGDLAEISRAYLAPAVFADPAFRAYAAVEGERVLGVASTTLAEGVLRVTGVGVRETARGRGIASALTAFAVRDHGGDLAFLEAEGDLPAFYARLGFRPVATWEIWLRSGHG